MSILAAKATHTYPHPAFEGLSEKALNALYSVCRNETLAAGTCLFNAGDTQRPAYLILTGTCELLAPVQGEALLLKLGRGSYVPVGLYADNDCSTATLMATDTVTVLSVDTNALGTLAADVQLALYRNLEREAARTTNLMLENLAVMSYAAQTMTASISTYLMGRAALYRDSAAIRSLLQKMPKLPPYVSKLTGMLISDTASTRSVVEVAKTDPSLTATVLKTVNSSYFNLRHKIVDFQHALVLLGFNQIYQIIASKGIQSTMPKTPEFQQLQYHSMMISVFCFEISLAVKQGSAPLLSTVGLLHDIGKSVILLLKHQHPNMAFLLNLLDPCMIGALLLREWQIPEEIATVLEYQNHTTLSPPESIPDDYRVNTSVLHVAHLCFEYMAGTLSGASAPEFFFAHMQVLGQKAGSIDEFVRHCLAPSMAARNSTLPKAIQGFLEGLHAQAAVA
jgi:HD-like signal output (HDOD) protein